MVKNSRGKFLNDLKAGQAAEIKVAKILKTFYGANSISQISEGKSHDFKLIFRDREEKVEVKNDLLSAVTQNAFIELSCGGKLSGICATQSDKYAFLFNHLNEVFVFCPKIMLKYLEGSKHKTLNGGDGKRVFGYIVKIDVLRKLPFVTVIPSLHI